MSKKFAFVFKESDLLNIFCVLSNNFILSLLFVNTR